MKGLIYVDLNRRLAISYYKTIATLNEPHKIYLVQHQETKKIYLKKILDIFNLEVYESLFNHPITGTPAIIDYMEQNGQLILIEEFISGISLEEIIESRTLNLDDIMAYMNDLCKILEQLHFHTPAIIHRDIKPSNIIITSWNHAVLLDFNAAKFHSPSATKDTVLLGTQGYAAPEQHGYGSSSSQTDIYTLGILLREMTEASGTYSPKLDRIITKCTQMNPYDRYHNIKELKKELFELPDSPSEERDSSPLARYALPGFRTKTSWKMFLAGFYYYFSTWLSFTLEVKNKYGLALWVNRIFLYIIFLFLVFGTCNYLNIQSILPLCRHKNRFLRYLGILILNISISLGILIILSTIDSIFFSS